MGWASRVRERYLSLDTAKTFILVAILAAAGFAILLDRGIGPRWARELPPWAQPLHISAPHGMLALVAVALAVLVAYPIHMRMRFLAPVVLVVWLVGALLVVVEFPSWLDTHAPRGESVATWVRLALIAFFAILFAKLHLMHRHATRAASRQNVHDTCEPLPTQAQDLAELARLIVDHGNTGSGRVIPIEGRWGEGKSFLLRKLRQRWEEDRNRTRRLGPPGRDEVTRPPAVVIVDVWQQETETDLQVAILEELLSHPAYLERGEWLHVPAGFLFARPMATFRKARTTLRLKLTKGGSSIEAGMEELPYLRWQASFEHLTTRLATAKSQRRRRTVIALDELDRATPNVTQAALTIARRSVDSPGVTVVLPYIPALIRYKAFHPLLPTLPDLASSMEAVIYEESLRLDRKTRLSGTERAASNPQSLYDWWAWREAEAERRADSSGEADKATADGPKEQHSLQRALQLAFANASAPERERLLQRFEEKYLGVPALVVHPPSARDLGRMTVSFPSLRPLVCKLIDSTSRDELQKVEASIEQGLLRWQKPPPRARSAPKVAPPPLRTLEGTLYRLLFQDGEFRGRLAPEEIATLAVVAYDLTSISQTNRARAQDGRGNSPSGRAARGR